MFDAKGSNPAGEPSWHIRAVGTSNNVRAPIRIILKKLKRVSIIVGQGLRQRPMIAAAFFAGSVLASGSNQRECMLDRYGVAIETPSQGAKEELHAGGL